MITMRLVGIPAVDESRNCGPSRKVVVADDLFSLPPVAGPSHCGMIFDEGDTLAVSFFWLTFQAANARVHV